MVVARRLDTTQSGSGQYLKAYLQLCRDAGYRTSLLFAPERSFGNLAWARIHPAFEALASDIRWPKTMKLGGTYVSLSFRVWRGMGIRIANELVRRVMRRGHVPYPSLLGHSLPDHERDALVREIDRKASDLVTVEYSSLGPLLSQLRSTPKTAVLLHDLFSLRAESFRAAGQEPDHKELSREDEAERCKDADLVVHSSATEKSIFHRALPRKTHIWMRPAFSLQTRRTSMPSPCLVFIGSQHSGNLDALRFIRERVWPHVREQVRNAEFHVIGTIASAIGDAEAEAEGITRVGEIPSLDAYGGANSIGLAPMHVGSGIPIKIVDYLALGMPVVAARQAMEAFGGTLTDIVCDAAQPAEYVAHLVRLLGDQEERERLSARSQTLSARFDNQELRDALT